MKLERPSLVLFEKTRNVSVHNELMDRGPRILVQMLSPDQSQMLHAEGLIDTGADITSFDEATIKKLGYKAHSKVKIKTAVGEELRGLYWVNLSLPQRNRPHRLLRVEVAGLGSFSHGHLPFGLIGRDVLRQGSLSYNGIKGEFQLDLLPDGV